jgi:hypothetical protein
MLVSPRNAWSPLWATARTVTSDAVDPATRCSVAARVNVVASITEMMLTRKIVSGRAKPVRLRRRDCRVGFIVVRLNFAPGTEDYKGSV